MTDTATLITQLRILGQLTRTEAQVARQRVVQASTAAVRDDLRQNAADADGRVARIADALRGLGALPDLVTPLLGRVAVLVRGAMEQAQPLDEALLGDLVLEHQLRDRARYVAALAAAADVPAVQTLAGELEAAHDETVRWLTSVLADLAGGQAALEASPLQRVAAQVTRAANAPSRPALDEVGGMVTRTVETVTAVGKGVGKDVKDTAAPPADAAGRDVAAQTAGQLARHLRDQAPRTHPRTLRRRPARSSSRRRSRGSPTSRRTAPSPPCAPWTTRAPSPPCWSSSRRTATGPGSSLRPACARRPSAPDDRHRVTGV